ncbi:MAG TPA: A24 family peptidase [Steroidobacteraceae bacterium]|nr:A24 family peptidase [Steroidobacteraceae bacterium]
MSELGEIFATTPWLFAGSVFLLSLMIGSFLNVVIHRLPIMLDREWTAQAREMLAEQEPSPQQPSPPPSPTSGGRGGTYNLIVPRSRCPHCSAEIKAHQNIPVVSYLLLGGKCANCRARISPRYPIVELVTAVLSTAVAIRFGWHWQTLAALLLTWSLIALTAVDLDHTILPDAITIPLLWLGLVLSLAWHAGLRPPAPVDPGSAIIGAAAGYLSLWIVYWVFKLLTGKEGMGYGDFKLFGALGAWMGWQMLPLVLLFSAFTGAVVGIALVVVRGRDRNIPIPFGPYLAAAGWIALMWGPQIVGGYMEFSGLNR